jgi:YcaO-like protein with predicted kinase domain
LTVLQETGAAVRKAFMNGTDRLVPPAETLERIRPHLDTLGITRVANITGLDRIGIPVVEAIRPDSRSLSVTQGKGLSLEAAKVSAIMESLECWHAERPVVPVRSATAAALSDGDRILALPDHVLNVRDDTWKNVEIPWVEARHVATGEPVFVPYDFVHFDTRPHAQHGASRRMFTRAPGTNGLASGNHPLEAVNHAMCELIERDAYHRWGRMTTAERISTSVDLATVDDPNCRWMLDRITAAGFTPLVQDITSAVGVPAFRCAIGADPQRAVRPEPFFLGWGCHPRREIALLRAVSEAAQARLTEISGARDNLPRAAYVTIQDRSQLIKNWAYVSKAQALRSFPDVPSYRNDTLEADTAVLLRRLRAVGLDEVLMVDLTREEIGVPVVKVVCTGLNHAWKHA